MSTNTSMHPYICTRPQVRALPPQKLLASNCPMRPTSLVLVSSSMGNRYVLLRCSSVVNYPLVTRVSFFPSSLFDFVISPPSTHRCVDIVTWLLMKTTTFFVFRPDLAALRPCRKVPQRPSRVQLLLLRRSVCGPSVTFDSTSYVCCRSRCSELDQSRCLFMGRVMPPRSPIFV